MIIIIIVIYILCIQIPLGTHSFLWSTVNIYSQYIYICMCVANVSRYHHEETRLLAEPTNRFTSYSVVTTHV